MPEFHFLTAVTAQTRGRHDMELLQSAAKSYSAKASHKRRRQKEQALHKHLSESQSEAELIGYRRLPHGITERALCCRRSLEHGISCSCLTSTHQPAAWSNTGDPVLSRHTYRLYHHSATTFWPGFDRGADKSHTPPFTLSWAVLREQGPALFHSMMWQAAMHLSVIHKKPITEHESVMHHSKAVSCILVEMRKPAESVDESTLWAMLGLATQESGGATGLVERDAGFRSLGLELQWLDFYGRRPLLKSHIKALYRIIDLKGGLDATVMPGFAGSIQITDLFQSTHCLSKPHFPLAAAFRIMDNMMQQRLIAVQASFELTTTGAVATSIMAKLSDYGLSDTFGKLIMKFRAFCLSVTGGMDDAAQDLSFLAVQRNLIHYSLLCTIPLGEDIDTYPPPVTSTSEAGSDKCDLDRLLQTGLLLFSVGVIFPLSNLCVWQVLIDRLKAQIAHSSAQLWKPGLRAVLVWLCMIGSLASV